MQRNNDHSIQEYVTGEESTKFLMNKKSTFYKEAIKEDDRVFDYNTYSQEIHTPKKLSFLETSVLKKEYLRCLDMPIRLKGQEEYSVPEEWKDLVPLIKNIVFIEQTHNPNWKDYYTYITVDCKYVTQEEQQRHGGLHVDGFQGTRINPKTKITRNYVMTTNGGTLFYPQRFVVADPEKFSAFKGFDLQAEKYDVAEENTVYFMDAYTVHESGFASHDGMRTFLRVTYDLKKFDRLGNTHNSSLDYDWDMVARNAQELVDAPRLTDILESPYFK